MKKILVSLFTSLVLIIAYTCNMSCRDVDNGEYMIHDVGIFKDTPVWELALAVQGQITSRIIKIVEENPLLINYKEPKYGSTLLLWAVGMEKYKSADALLKCGADPNISTYEGKTPLFIAAGFSWVDRVAKKDPKYVKLLLRYGADPNKYYTGIPGEKTFIEVGTSPLMESIGCGIEKTKALVEAGADINYKTESGLTAAITALNMQGYFEYAHYLIVEKKANVTEPFCIYLPLKFIDPALLTKLFYPVDLLRDWVFDLDSKEYKIKMEVVDEFARQGVNYWSTKIPESKLEQIKKLYPNNWVEYSRKY